MGLQRIKLNEVGVVRGGQIATAEPAGRSAPEAWRALQAGDLDAEGSVDWSALRWVIPAGAGERSVIREGDVLVPLRSTRVGALVARNVPPRTIAIGHWAIITPSALVLPDYLAWYLSHPSTERELSGNTFGSNLTFVRLSVMRELEIEVPDLETQRKIVRVQSLHRRQAELEQQLTGARTQYINIITKAALERGRLQS
jgi:hypothetical protein